MKNRNKPKLLQFYFCACCSDLFLHSFSVFLGEAFLNCLRSAFYEVLSFLEAETCDFTDNLDNVELLSAEGLKNYVEFCLFFCCGSCCACCACNCYWSCCGYAEFLIYSINEVCELENCKSLDGFKNLE